MSDPYLDALYDADRDGAAVGVDLAVVRDRVLPGLSDADLRVLAEAVDAERHHRALTNGDLDAVSADAFVNGFDAKGWPKDPWITAGGLLVCPAAKIGKSKMAHRCRFVHVNDNWAWEHADAVHDDVRYLGDANGSLQAVTILVAPPGATVDVVTSKARGGEHTRERVTNYRIDDGALVVGPTRVVAAASTDR